MNSSCHRFWLLAALGAAACAGSDPVLPIYDEPDASTDAPPGPGGGGDGGGACEATYDPATLPACCPEHGGAHCLPDDAVPEHLRATLDPCPDGGLCVPDPQIEGAPPRSCTSIGGAAGACMSLCVPEVAAAADLLPTAGCGPTERCAPCVNPVDGTSTGACEPACAPEPGERPSPPDAGAGAASCCDGAGTCLPVAVVGDDAARLGVDTCAPDQGLVCVPGVYLDGDYVPPSCSTGLIALFFGDAYRPGVCLPACIPAVAGALFVGQDDCGDLFRCVPCLDPTTGAPSGACETP